MSDRTRSFLLRFFSYFIGIPSLLMALAALIVLCVKIPLIGVLILWVIGCYELTSYDESRE
jgi:hypothetical protein